MTENVSDAIALRRAESLTAIVQRELERMIVVGELRAGDRLNEQALAQRFGVSRGPVREAMRALECANLVSTRLNQGFFVREISPEEIAEIYDMRAVVYGFICARLATTISAEALAALDAAIEEMDTAIATGDGKEYYRLNLAFHEQTIVCAAHNCAQQTYRSLINESHLARQRSLVEPERMRESNAEHRRLVEALKAGDAELARELGNKHVLAGRRRWKASVAEEDAIAASVPPHGAAAGATLVHK
ncbi:MAG: GntR family transcriptional regulator [Rhodospirillaceae bacterium]|nr:GntR family transcriptional regulator [Rhodospirillaceae bacterium]